MINDKKILFSVLTLCILIFVLSTVSAADMNSANQTQITHINQSTPAATQDAMTTTTSGNVKEAGNVNMAGRSKKSVKQSAITKEVSNYDELGRAVAEADNDNSNNYLIKLNNGSYTYNSTINWGNNTPKKLTINLNNQTFTCNGISKIDVFNIADGYSLNLENQGNNSLDILNYGNLTVNTYSGSIANYGNLSIENTTVNDSGISSEASLVFRNCIVNGTVNNDGVLTVSDDTVTGTNALITGSGTVISNTTFVDSYDKLKQVINNASNNTVTVSLLNGSYKSNGVIRLQNQKCKNIIIRGNGQIINCTGYQFLDISPAFNVTIVNTVLAGYTRHNGTILNNGILTLNNNTFTNIYGEYYDCYLRNNGNLTINNSRIADSIVVHMIYSSSGSLKVLNSNFMNNTVYDGMFYLHNTTGFIFNSTFSSTNASLWGGVLCLNNSRVNIISSEFMDNNALHYGGVIYSYNSKLTVNNSVFFGNYAPMGGVIVALNGSVVNAPVVNIGDSFFYNNTAVYEGGVIYNVYTNLNIMSSVFEGNHARSGGVIYADCLKLSIVSSEFNNNHANNYGGALSVNQADINISNTDFTANSASHANDMYSQFNRSVTLNNNSWNDINPVMVNLTRQSASPSVIIGNISDVNITGIPSKYDLRDYGWVTSVKNQGSDGNCWAFAAMASLESCILKAINKSYDFSENNLKNIMAAFSQYGFNDLPNEGGTISMAISYLVNWYGPVSESMDAYTVSSTISPLLESMIHITDVYGIPSRANATDNNLVKEAIMKYGGVYSKIFMVSTSYPAWYTTFNSFNHAVCIIGWDDNYSRNNFASAPAGDGAFIVKNSWGSDAGDEGYYYVSYYDKSILCSGEYIGGFTFILNDTAAYDNIYQYDYGGKSDRWYVFNNMSVSYSNEYIINGDETLKAFGTYVYNNKTNYTLQVYIDDSLKYTMNGNFTHAGYETVKINKTIPVHAGDRVKIKLALHPMNQGNIAVPISESYYTRVVKTDKSLINDENRGNIAVLKLYTMNGIDNNTVTMRAKILNNKINSTILNLKVWKGGDILDKGVLTVMENNRTINQINMNSNATDLKLPYSTTGRHNIIIYYNSTIENNISAEFYVNKINTDLTPDSIPDTEYNNTLTISGRLFDEYGGILANQEIQVYVNNIKYAAFTDENGAYNLTYKTNTTGLNTLTVRYSGNNIYEYTYINMTFNVTRINTVVKTGNFTGYLDNIVTINATVTNNKGIPITGGAVEIRLDGRTLGAVNVTDDGLAEYKLNLTKTGYARGNYTVTFVYKGTDVASGSVVSTNLEVLPVSITIKAGFTGKINNSRLTVMVYDGYNIMDTGNLSILENNTVITMLNMNNIVTVIKLPYNSSGVHNLIIRYSTNNLVVDAYQTVSVLKINTMLTVNNITDVEYNRTVVITGILFDEYEGRLNNQNITVHVNNQSYNMITNSTGGYTLSIKAQHTGLNIIHVIYNGSNQYNTTMIHAEFNTKKIMTKLELDPVSSVLYDKNTIITGRLYDSYNNPLKNETISIQVNKNKYSAKTDSGGKFTLEFKEVPPGVNTVTVTYPGNNVFSQITANTTFTGQKHDTILTINMIEDTLYDSYVNITGKLTDANNTVIKDALITLKVNSKTYTSKTNNNGTYTLNIPAAIGENTVEVSYNDNRYNKINNTRTFTGLKHNTITTINKIDDTLFDTNTRITGILRDANNTPVDNAVITVTVNGVNYTTITNNGIYTLNASSNLGINNIIITYNGSSLYNKTDYRTTFTGLKHNTIITLHRIEDTIYDSYVNITGKITDANNTIIQDAMITIEANNKTYTSTTNTSGEYIILNIPVIPETNNITVTYNGNASYNKAENNNLFTGLKHDTKIVLDNTEDVLYDNITTISGLLLDANSTPIYNAMININNISAATDTNGKFKVKIKADININNITVSYNGNSMYNNIINSTAFTGLKHDTAITLKNINNTPYNQEAEINGVLKDINGTPVNNTAVLINKKEVLTDNNGKFTAKILVNIGMNNITVTYKGNSKYNPSNTSTVFTGLKHNTAITVNKIPDTPYDNKINITGTLTDTDTQTNIANTELTININNITYTSTTNTAGEYIILNIPAIPESNNITVTYNGNKTYTNTTSIITFTGLAHNTTLTINPINSTAIGNNITITGTLTDTNSTRIDNATITVTLNK